MLIRLRWPGQWQAVPNCRQETVWRLGFWRKQLRVGKMQIFFYTKSDCRLCEEVALILAELSESYEFVVRRRDIRTNFFWYQAYKETIPLVEFEDGTILKSPISRDQIVRIIEKLAAQRIDRC